MKIKRLFNFRCANNSTDTEIQGKSIRKEFRKLGHTSRGCLLLRKFRKNFLFRNSQAENAILFANEISRKLKPEF